MGNTISKRMSESDSDLRKKIDLVVKEIMFDSTEKDLIKLANEKYCNRLVKKVSDVFQQHKDTIDLNFLRQRLYSSKHSDKVNSESTNNETPKKSNTPKLHNVKKKCTQISKFYILFWHLFACIVTTVNPSFDLNDKASTSTATSTSTSKTEDKKQKTSPFDFCTLRIDTLVNGKLNVNSDGDMEVKPNICKTNISDSGSPLHFLNLPGMMALKNLDQYVDDDVKKDDARLLYLKFTGKEAPNNITTMEQIPLRTFNDDIECKKSSRKYDDGDNDYEGGGGGGTNDDDAEEKERRREKERQERRRIQEQERRYYYSDRKKDEEEDIRSGIYLKGITGSIKERLFSEYVENIKVMMENSQMNRSKLLEILSEMFIYTYDDNEETSGGGRAPSVSGVVINPSLTYKQLQSLVSRTRKIIIKLYTDCEEDYNNGLDIYFALVQEKIALRLSINENKLKDQMEKIMYGPSERYIPESLLFQYEQQGRTENFTKQFVPPHFKSSVISAVKKSVADDDFRQILPQLNEWMNEEIENATVLLNAENVASEFLKTQYEPSSSSSSSSSTVLNSAPASVLPINSSTSAPAASSPIKSATNPTSSPSGPPFSPSSRATIQIIPQTTDVKKKLTFN